MSIQSRAITEPNESASSDYVVLLPIIDLDEALRLLPMAVSMARLKQGRVLVLGIVEIEEEYSLSDGLLAARRYRAELDAIAAFNVNEPVQVRTSVHVDHSQAAAIRTTVQEEQASLVLLGWQEENSSPERLFGPPIDTLLREPPCDTIVMKLRNQTSWQRILLPVRGGPHTPLACDTALALADLHDSAITVLYATDPRQPDNQVVRNSLQGLRSMPRVQRWIERAIPAEQAILSEAPEHQAIILGVTGRRGDPEAPLGPLTERILRRANETVLLVRHRLDQNEERAQDLWQQQRDLSATVDRWFAENNFASTEFEDLERLLALKQQQGLTVSLGLPALNEEETLGPIIKSIKTALMDQVPLLDEIVLIDSRSTDRTCEIARELGVPVYVHQDILPKYGSFPGKGEALWKSQFVLKGDIIAWIDTDIKNIHPRFVYGIIGPLLRDPKLMYCKGFYRRPIKQGDKIIASGGGRVTELTARPLLNLFYPELSGMVQPLSGEYAGRREALEWLPFFTGYGVETAMLIDLLEQHGLQSLAQVDLHERVHRNQELVPLSKMAFAIIQVVIQRLEQRHRLHVLDAVNQSMKLIQQGAEQEGSFRLELRDIRDHERPPMASIPEYRKMRGLPSAPSAGEALQRDK